MKRDGRDARHGPFAPWRGRTGGVTYADLLGRLGPITGTLAVGNVAGWSLTVLRDGDVVQRVTIGVEPDAASVDLPFVFHPHAVAEVSGAAAEAAAGDARAETATLPELPALLPQATWPGLVSVPHGPDVTEIPAGLGALPSLGSYLEASDARGILTIRSDDAHVAALVAGGRIVAAVGARGGREVRRGDAMRLLALHASHLGSPAMRFAPLPEPIFRAVAGAILDHHRDVPHGLHVGEHDATVACDGEDRLRVAYGFAERLGSFGTDVDLDTLAALPLPDEPLDWESRTYQLTLRGRDVLDPMTEVAMRFDHEHGDVGRAILHALRRGMDVEATATEVGIELDALSAWLQRFERDGLVRLGGER